MVMLIIKTGKRKRDEKIFEIISSYVSSPSAVRSHASGRALLLCARQYGTFYSGKTE
jgi:hypothetical protein